QAIALWTKLRSVLPPGSPQFAQIEAALARAGVTLPPAASPAASPATGGTVSGRVELDPALARNVAPTDTVFIFARDPDGARVPLAALKLTVQDLPRDFELTDAMAMNPDATISRATKVVVEARVSRSGNAKAAAGDLAGSSAPVAPGAHGVVVKIDRIVP
ncbi:MAG: c-type cytochrome biogenesis protein CcmI, partial [Burkholderiales bacterium]|nr:c-type cytochrome biogenesis protein CcmI [Burkholderiales bacterium]